MKTRVDEVYAETDNVRVVTLAAIDGTQFQRPPAGAHIDVHTASGVVRQYSLLDHPKWRDGIYRIAVKLEDDSRGGSQAIHQLEVGDELTISAPRSTFPLQEDDAECLLLGAGIGVTPLLSMVASLQEQGKKYRVLLVDKDENNAPLTREFAEIAGPQLATLYGENMRDKQLELVRSYLQNCGSPSRLGVYVCGPREFIERMTTLAALYVPDTRIHVEIFSTDGKHLVDLPEAGPVPSRTAGDSDARKTPDSFEVELEGQTYTVGSDQSILEVLEDAGVPIMSSCWEGICGTCALVAVEGEVDHRDEVFTAQQHADGLMTTCVSRALTSRLVLRRRG